MSINSLKTRLDWMGGDANSRIKKQKFRSFHAALLNDYNSRKIELQDETIWPCLINLDNLKADYDKKYISIDYESMLEPGDTFMTVDDKVHWMIYLPDLVETAYLRSEIIRCRYTIDIDDETYWIYFQGPTETDIRWALNHSMTYNELNLSGTIYIKNTTTTKEYFERFKQFKIAGHTWEAQVIDYISVPGIIEIEVQEYFDNSIADLPEIIKEKPLVVDDEIIPQPIIGQNIAQRGSTIGFTAIDEIYNPNITWKVIGNENVEIAATHMDGRICEVKVHDCAVGMFTVVYGKHNYEVHIQSFRPEIIGPTEVYPYETYEYQINGTDGEFVLDTTLAKIVEQKSNYCKIEIVSGKKGTFSLKYDELLTGNRFELPIRIKSL